MFRVASENSFNQLVDRVQNGDFTPKSMKSQLPQYETRTQRPDPQEVVTKKIVILGPSNRDACTLHDLILCTGGRFMSGSYDLSRTGIRAATFNNGTMGFLEVTVVPIGELKEALLVSKDIDGTSAKRSTLFDNIILQADYLIYSFTCSDNTFDDSLACRELLVEVKECIAKHENMTSSNNNSNGPETSSSGGKDCNTMVVPLNYPDVGMLHAYCKAVAEAQAQGDMQSTPDVPLVSSVARTLSSYTGIDEEIMFCAPMLASMKEGLNCH